MKKDQIAYIGAGLPTYVADAQAQDNLLVIPNGSGFEVWTCATSPRTTRDLNTALVVASLQSK